MWLSPGDASQPLNGQVPVEEVTEPAGEVVQVRCKHMVLMGVHALPVLVQVEQGRILDALVQVVVDLTLLLAGRMDQRLQRIAKVLLPAASLACGR